MNYIRSLNFAQPPTQLELLSVSNRLPTLQNSGTPGADEVQASTNLGNWPAIATVSTATNTLPFKDSAGTNFPQRFYRARQ